MELRYSPTSPYARKVRVTAIELGLDGRIEGVVTLPWDAATDLPKDNPLGKVPLLVTDDGQKLYDSPVICEYLDSLAGGDLFPAAGTARWTALRRQALADGMMDATALCRLEGMRPPERQSADWIARQRRAIERGLDVLEAEAPELQGDVTIGHITIGCALGFIDFRLPDDRWRDGRPALAAWYEDFAARPSMAATVPQE